MVYLCVRALSVISFKLYYNIHAVHSGLRICYPASVIWPWFPSFPRHCNFYVLTFTSPFNVSPENWSTAVAFPLFTWWISLENSVICHVHHQILQALIFIQEFFRWHARAIPVSKRLKKVLVGSLIIYLDFLKQRKEYIIQVRHYEFCPFVGFHKASLAECHLIHFYVSVICTWPSFKKTQHFPTGYFHVTWVFKYLQEIPKWENKVFTAQRIQVRS